jgi:hypothetical protein
VDEVSGRDNLVALDVRRYLHCLGVQVTEHFAAGFGAQLITAVTGSVAQRWMSDMIVERGSATAVSEFPAAGGVAWGPVFAVEGSASPQTREALTNSKIRHTL